MPYCRFGDSPGWNPLLEVFAVPQVVDRPAAPLGGNLATALGERAIPGNVGHAGGRLEGSQVERPDKRVGTDEGEVERVPLLVGDDPVVVAVVADLVLHHELDLGPMLLQEPVVLRHQVFAKALEHGAALAVGGVGLTRVFAAEADAARLAIESDAQVLHNAGTAFQLRKESGHPLGVIPDVRARAVAAADPLPGPEAAVSPPLHRVGRQRADRHQDAGQKPAGQGAVEIRLVEEVCQLPQSVEVVFEVMGNGQSIRKPIAVHPSVLAAGKVPREQEDDLFFLPRLE